MRISNAEEHRTVDAKKWIGSTTMILLVIVTIGLVAIGLCSALKPRASGGLEVSWRPAQQPRVVLGRVVDDRDAPVVGQTVILTTFSGGNTVITDAEGVFARDVGESELISLEVLGSGAVRWRELWPLSITNGVVFDVKLTGRPTGAR